MQRLRRETGTYSSESCRSGSLVQWDWWIALFIESMESKKKKSFLVLLVQQCDSLSLSSIKKRNYSPEGGGLHQSMKVNRLSGRYQLRICEERSARWAIMYDSHQIIKTKFHMVSLLQPQSRFGAVACSWTHRALLSIVHRGACCCTQIQIIIRLKIIVLEIFTTHHIPTLLI